MKRFEIFKQWWSADTDGWPTFMVLIGFVVFFWVLWWLL
jgi:hypothetical protein